jgi:hypothetical protein
VPRDLNLPIYRPLACESRACEISDLCHLPCTHSCGPRGFHHGWDVTPRDFATPVTNSLILFLQDPDRRSHEYFNDPAVLYQRSTLPKLSTLWDTCNIFLATLSDPTVLGFSRFLLGEFRSSILPHTIPRKGRSVSPRDSLSTRQPVTLPLNFQRQPPLHLSFNEFEGLLLLSFLANPNYLEGTLHALLAANLQLSPSVEVFRPCALLQ